MVFPELTVPRLLSALFQIVFTLLSVKFIKSDDCLCRTETARGRRYGALVTDKTGTQEWKRQTHCRKHL